MSIGSRIKECRENLGITQEELATLLGVSKGAIGNYEAGIGYPKVENMTKLFKILKTDANFLFQDEVSTKIKEMLTSQEREHIKKYRHLDAHGKKIVNLVLNEEYDRCTAISENEDSKPEIDVIYSKIYADEGGVIKKETPADLPKISDFFDD